MLVLMQQIISHQKVDDIQLHGKSPKLYLKMRKDNILPLPSYTIRCKDTLKKFIQYMVFRKLHLK